MSRQSIVLYAMAALYAAAGAPAAEPHASAAAAPAARPAATRPVSTRPAAPASRPLGLDVVLVVDATDSMLPHIQPTRQRLRDIIDLVAAQVPSVRFGAVIYKDYGDEYGFEPLRVLPLTTRVQAVTAFLDEITIGGGADRPEPIHEALRAATDTRRMGWSSSRRQVIILLADSPVHSTGRTQALRLASAFARRGGTIIVLDASSAEQAATPGPATVQADLARIARQGKGSAFLLLAEADKFWRYLIGLLPARRSEQEVRDLIDKYVRSR